MFETTSLAGWGDMDFNSHMRNTAYLDKSGDARMQFFAAHDFPVPEFARLRIGPVVMKDEVEYFREIHLLEQIKVTLALIAMAEDGSRFQLRNEFFRADGQLAARVTSTGGWLDLGRRKLIAPPEGLLAAMRIMGQGGEVKILPSSLNAKGQ